MKFLLFFFSFIFFIITCEYVIRIINNDNKLLELFPASQQYQLDSDLIYSMIPNTQMRSKTDEFTEIEKINSQGFRDNDFLVKDNHTYRIIAIGDSFIYGHGIESNNDTYPKQLEKYFLDKTIFPQKKIEVLNMGIKGYSPDQEYRLIEKRVLKWHPDMIIWNLFNPGDITDIIHNPDWPIPALYTVKNNDLIPLNARYNWLYISNLLRYNFPIINKSYLFNFIVKKLSGIKILSQKPMISDVKLYDWAKSKLTLEIINADNISKNNNIIFVLVILPSKEIIEHENQRNLQTSLMQSVLKTVRKNNIFVIDVGDIISRKIRTNFNLDLIPISKLYFRKDFHPNEVGSTIFAKIVAEELNKYILSSNKNILF